MENVKKKKLKKYYVCQGMPPGSEFCPVMDFYEGCNEYSFSIKKGNFVTLSATTSLLKVTVIRGVSYEH